MRDKWSRDVRECTVVREGPPYEPGVLAAHVSPFSPMGRRRWYVGHPNANRHICVHQSVSLSTFLSKHLRFILSSHTLPQRRGGIIASGVCAGSYLPTLSRNGKDPVILPAIPNVASTSWRAHHASSMASYGSKSGSYAKYRVGSLLRSPRPLGKKVLEEQSPHDPGGGHFPGSHESASNVSG